MFSNLSESSISLATVTPSLVTLGAPKDFSITTLRPLGPNVTFTASARAFTPFKMAERASSEKRSSLADIFGSSDQLIQNAENVFLTHHEEFFAVNLNF